MNGTKTRSLNRLQALAVALVATAGVGLAAAPSASASGGWGGKCHPFHDSNTVGGWCDGNGPDYRYAAFGKCRNDNYVTYGVTRWAGDRRGSYVYCAGHGGVDYSWGWGLSHNW